MKGTEFKIMRESLGLTQEELAEILCLSGKHAVSNIETGFRNPSMLSYVCLKIFSELPKAKSQVLQAQFKRIANKTKGKRGQ